ncbi:DUF1993 domain-containing protein [Acaryochloris sp. IP29b_bin.137]|uniref:DUF1993 domain-containing protein n=1 Tax=Acaryochloris sp. IP29b_bin.137 TaxID=2969217 RepID=UPI00261871E9|nr:DUF1993 domain-containing protein [Acaryochloris sp. IP29b_bin.137]
MPSQAIASIQTLFQSRLATLEHLVKTAQTHFSDNDSFLQKRIAADMLPFGTQIAFTCDQPHNFTLWSEGKSANHLDPKVTSLSQAYEHIANTQKKLVGINVEDDRLAEITRIDLGDSLYLELSGINYINEFLIPNFYFHLVTAYDILRMVGVPIGKRDYMMHLVPLVKQG